MHVIQIESNALSPNGQPYSFQLGRLTLLTGRNGSGKTTLSTVLRLALTGTTDDMIGRSEVKDPQLLARMMPEGSEIPLFATATFSDGHTAHWGMVVEANGTVKRPQHEFHLQADPERVLALRAVWSLLQGDEKVARRTLLTWIGQSVSEEDALALIPTHLHGKYRDIAEKQPGTVVDKVVAVAEYATRRAREVEADAAAQDRLVDQLSGSLTVKPDTATIEGARATVAQWRALYEQARGWEEPPSGEALLEKQQELLAAQEAVEQWRAEVNRLEQEDEHQSAPIQAHTNAIHLLLPQVCDIGTCPVCGSSPGPVHLRSWAAWHLHQRDVLKASFRSMLDVITDATEARDSWVSEVQKIQIEMARMQGQWVALEGRPRPPVPLSDCEAGLREAEAYLSGLERSVGNWETVKTARDAAAELRSSKPAYQELSAACNQAVVDLLDKLTETFCARAQVYLPDRWRIGLRIRDSFEIGFLRGGRLHTLLSGTEYDALSVAVTMAVADLGGGASLKKKRGRPAKAGEVKEVYTLVIPADRGRDPETLGELMRCWAKFSGQVVVEATEPPKGRVSKDWTVIDVEAWRAALTAPQEAPGAATEVSAGPELVSGSNGVVHTPAEEVTVNPTPPVEEPTPQVDHAEALRALNFKESEVERLRYMKAGAKLVEQKIPRVRCLITHDRVVTFSPQGNPGETFML